ncbi:MAG: oligopeptide-binding protein oppA, partial [Nitrospinae bacterium RIFCSPLOWO2_12_FULL_47_7]
MLMVSSYPMKSSLHFAIFAFSRSPQIIRLAGVWMVFGFLLPFLFSCAGQPQDTDKERVFRMSIGAEPPTLDWSLATDGISFDVLNNLMEGLTQYDSNLEPVPAVAQKWEFSKDGKTLTYYLRNDVYWTDGKPVTAMDFEFSWKRLLNPATAAEYAYFLFDVENAQEYNSGKLKDASQVGIQALSPTVLQIRLKRPVVYFPSITTFMVTFPQREDIISRYGVRWTEPGNMVTNGPFILTEWHHEYKLVLTANNKYHDASAAKNAVTKAVIYIVRDTSTALTLYETGDLDTTGLPPVAIPSFKNSPEYKNLPLLRGYYYGFNTKKRPFDNTLVRQALAHAIDRSHIAEILQGGEIPTSSWIPKGMPGYNPDIGPKFDPEKAQRLLAQAGYPEGKNFPAVMAIYNSDPNNRLIAEFIQNQWKKHLNISVKFENQEWKVYLSGLKMDTPHIFRLGWGADFPDPDNFMNLFTSASGNNHLHWSNPQYDELVAQGAAEHNPAKRQA